MAGRVTEKSRGLYFGAGPRPDIIAGSGHSDGSVSADERERNAAESMLEAILHSSRFECPFCRAAASLRREERRGFVQRKLSTLFHLYPWECVLCRRLSFHRHRSVKSDSQAMFRSRRPGHPGQV